MHRLRVKLLRRSEGQSLIEAAIVIPFLLVFIFNAINIGYFFFAYLNMATAPRQGTEYSIQGSTTIYGKGYPTPDAVNSLVQAGMSGSLPNSSSVPMRVCTLGQGVSTPPDNTQVPLCTSYGTGTFSALQPDPEAPLLVLNRVDVQYTVTPLIPGGAFNLIFPPSLTFHRYVYMRAE